jgi:hypothetical protein
MHISELKNLTTYGIIKGARQFIVGIVEKQLRSMEDYGYCMEKNILKARELGLTGDWNVSDPQIKSGSMEYIVSWIAHDQV